MNNALIVHNTLLPQLQKTLCAAQYVRMSTDYQRYSIENQAATIAAYASLHQLSIVRTYRDEGESGLRLKNRSGLIQLLDDVRSGNVGFGHILVYDVSRWGRFQDTDESAHYEFICKQAGIKVVYCAEQFDNDGSMLSSIVKNIKRVMAAEYSRELSAKVSAGKSRIAGLGYWVGGRPGFALSRELVDLDGHSRGLLSQGQRKWIPTDRVILRPGPADETAVIQRIFDAFVRRRVNETAIARELNEIGVLDHRGLAWTNQMIGRILRNEVYIGNAIYLRTSNKLRQPRVINVKGNWIRSENALEPIIERELFEDAQRILQRRVEKFSSDELLKKLRVLKQKRGRLTRKIINQTCDMPKTFIYDRRFGSLRAAYALIGHTPETDCQYVEDRAARTRLIMELADQVTAGLPTIKPGLISERSGGCLAMPDGTFLSLRVARCWHHTQKKRFIWILRRGAKTRAGLIVVVRMDERNLHPLEYILVPFAEFPSKPLHVTEDVLTKQYKSRFQTVADLIRALRRRLSKESTAKPQT